MGCVVVGVGSPLLWVVVVVAGAVRAGGSTGSVTGEMWSGSGWGQEPRAEQWLGSVWGGLVAGGCVGGRRL